MPTVSEVMTIDQVERMAAQIDVLQIGARNMQNFDLLEVVHDRAEVVERERLIFIALGFGRIRMDLDQQTVRADRLRRAAERANPASHADTVARIDPHR